MALPILSLMIFVPLITAPLVYILGRYSERAVKIFVLLVSIGVFGIAIYSYASILFSGAGAEMSFEEGPWQWIPTFQGIDYHLGLDGLSGPLVLISAFLTILVVLGSWDLIKIRQPLYYALILFFEGSVIGVFTSLNLILFYVFWEIVLIPMFFFIGIWGGPRRKYAAMKFLLFTYTGSLIMLLGFLALYIFASPTFDMQALALVNIPFWLQTLASIATFVGFGVKLPVVPFHTWLPDAHVQAPAPISVFLAGVLLKMGGYGFIRVNLSLFPDASQTYSWIFMSIGLITMFYGAIVALKQTDMKRMIALTSINHMGFVLLGAYTFNLYGVSGAIFQMFNHAAAIGLLFMLTGYIHEQMGTREIPLLKGLMKRMPTTAVLLMLGSLAGMGLPMFANFLSEYMVIVGAISYNWGFAVAVLVPVITAAYFLWMIQRTIMTPLKNEASVNDISNISALHLSIYLVPLILLLIFPWIVLNLTNVFAENLLQLVG